MTRKNIILIVMMRCITTCSLKTQGLCHFQRKVSRGQGFRIQSDKSSQQRAFPESSDATLPGKMLRCLPARNKRYKIKLHRKKRINFKANVICARSLHRIKDTLVDSNEIMFQCTFKIHGRKSHEARRSQRHDSCGRNRAWRELKI